MIKEYINQTDKKVVLKMRNTFIQMDMKSITIIMCDGYLSTLYFLNEQKQISVSKLLKDFEKELAPYGFFRVNRNTLVNVNNIYSIQNGNSRIVTMVDNHKICVSFRKITQLRKLLKIE